MENISVQVQSAFLLINLSNSLLVAFKNAALEKFSEIKEIEVEELEIHGSTTGEFCLSRPPSTLLFSKDENAQISGNFFCKNELFDDEGRVIMFHGNLDFCEHLKLNKSFVLDHHLLDSEFLGENFIIINLLQQNASWIPFWHNVKSGWKTNEKVERSEMDFCIEEAEVYHVQYCLPDREGEKWSVKITTSKTQT